MILVLGGYASGKRTYVRSLGFRDNEMSPDPTSGAPVLLDLQDALRAGDVSPEALASKQVVVCCEVGSGLVPINADDRAWRERVGRTCATLAAQADQVVRLIAGIPVRLK